MDLNDESMLPQSPMNETVYDHSSHKALAYRDAREVAPTDSNFLSKELYDQSSNVKSPPLVGASEQSWKKRPQYSQSSDYDIKVSWPSANVEGPSESASVKAKALPVRSPYVSPPPEQFGTPDSRPSIMHSGTPVRTRNKRIRDLHFKSSLDTFDISSDSPSNVPPTSPTTTSSDLSYPSSPLLHKTSNAAAVISTSSNTKFPILGIPHISGDSHKIRPGLEGNLSPFQGLSADTISATSPSDNRESSAILSDISDSDNDEDIQNPVVRKMICVSCNVLLEKYLNKTPCKIKQQAPGEPRPSEVETRRRLSSKGTSDSGKRKQDKPVDGPDNGDNSTGHKRPRLNSNIHVDSKERPFACPFYKFDVTLFGPTSPDEKYRGCIQCCFTNIAQLKQHLQRNHYLPPYYCPRCCRHNFSSQADLMRHLRDDSRCEKRDPPLYCERIGSDLIEELSIDRRNPPGMDPAAYWHKVFKAFFPNEARPVHPYYEGPVAEVLNHFDWFCKKNMPEILPIAQQHLVRKGTHLDARLLSEEIRHEALQRFLLFTSKATMPHLSGSSAHQRADGGSGSPDLPRYPLSYRPRTPTRADQRNSNVADSSGLASNITTNSGKISSSSSRFFSSPWQALPPMGQSPHPSQQAMPYFATEDGQGAALAPFGESTETPAVDDYEALDLPPDFIPPSSADLNALFDQFDTDHVP